MKFKALFLSLVFVCQPVFASVDFSTDDVVDISNSVASLGAHSFSAWIKPGFASSATTDRDVFVRQTTGGDTDRAVRVVWDGPTFITDSRLCYSYNFQPAAFSAGEWHQVGYVRTGANNLVFYWDGVAQTTNKSSDNSCINNTANMSFHIGALTNQNFWLGQISEVAVWSSALTSQDMANLGRSRVKRMPCQISSSTRVFYLPMDEGQDGTSADGDTFRDPCGSLTGLGSDGANNADLTWKAEEVLSYS